MAYLLESYKFFLPFQVTNKLTDQVVLPPGFILFPKIPIKIRDNRLIQSTEKIPYLTFLA